MADNGSWDTGQISSGLSMYTNICGTHIKHLGYYAIKWSIWTNVRLKKDR